MIEWYLQCSADACIVALLWKLQQMPSCSANNANLDTNNFDMFYKIDCCAAIHCRIWMNNVPNESRIILLSCTEISLLYIFARVLFFFFFSCLFIVVKPGFPWLFLSFFLFFLFFLKSHCILIAAYLEKEQQEYGIFLKYLPYHCQMQHIFMVYIQQFWNTQESKINLLINAHLQSTFH